MMGKDRTGWQPPDPSLQIKVGLLVERQGRLLLVRRSQGSAPFPGCWGLPAVAFEAGKEPPRAAVRRIAGETGLHVEVGRLVEAHFFGQDRQGLGLLLVYEAGLAGDEGQVDSGGSAASAFFPSERIPDGLCAGGHDQAINSWRERGGIHWQPGRPMRFCPHCTQPLVERVAFDRRRSVCLACGFVEFRAPKVGVSVLVIDEEGNLLLVRRAEEPGKGKWSLPSGFVEWDESPEEAAIRECAEETGLAVTDLRLFDVAHYTDDYRGPGINLTYRARVAEGLPRPGDDAAEARYFTPGELPSIEDLAFATHRALLARWREG